MRQATQILKKLGGASKAASLLGLPYSTVAHWEIRGGVIPEKYRQRILDCSAKHGLKVSREDFVRHLRDGRARCKAKAISRPA